MFGVSAVFLLLETFLLENGFGAVTYFKWRIFVGEDSIWIDDSAKGIDGTSWLSASSVRIEVDVSEWSTCSQSQNQKTGIIRVNNIDQISGRLIQTSRWRTTFKCRTSWIQSYISQQTIDSYLTFSSIMRMMSWPLISKCLLLRNSAETTSDAPAVRR